MATTFVSSTSLTTIDCGLCGGTYAIQERYLQEKVEVGGFWHCPYCKCSWGYGEGENDKLKKQLEQERQRVLREQQRHDQTKAGLRETERRLIAQRGVTTRIKNRVANGVCPCCKRNFSNLAAHMKTKHPAFATAN